MRWIGGRESENVEDRRSGGGGGMVVGGGIGTLVIAVVVYLLGGDPSQILSSGGQEQVATQQTSQGPQPDDEAAKFTRVVLAYTEDVWTSVMANEGQQYKKPVLVLFRGATQSGCGPASAASGPFYCPADGKLYIDLSFYDELQQRFNAPGDFAMAYVVAHEIGHHIQDQWGILDKVHQAQQCMSQTDANRLSVRLELQADYLAGVWAHHAQRQFKILQEGDVEEAFNAAAAIGDDNIQKSTQGYVTPEGFTHGTAAQRAYWFKKGFERGDINQGDTFNTREDARLEQ